MSKDRTISLGRLLIGQVGSAMYLQLIGLGSILIKMPRSVVDLIQLAFSSSNEVLNVLFSFGPFDINFFYPFV